MDAISLMGEKCHTKTVDRGKNQRKADDNDSNPPKCSSPQLPSSDIRRVRVIKTETMWKIVVFHHEGRRKSDYTLHVVSVNVN